MKCTIQAVIDLKTNTMQIGLPGNWQTHELVPGSITISKVEEDPAGSMQESDENGELSREDYLQEMKRRAILWDELICAMPLSKLRWNSEAPLE